MSAALDALLNQQDAKSDGTVMTSPPLLASSPLATYMPVIQSAFDGPAPDLGAVKDPDALALLASYGVTDNSTLAQVFSQFSLTPPPFFSPPPSGGSAPSLGPPPFVPPVIIASGGLTPPSSPPQAGTPVPVALAAVVAVLFVLFLLR